MKTTLKIAPPLKICFCPPPLKKLPEIFLMTSHYDSHTTTDVKPEMIPDSRNRALNTKNWLSDKQ